METNRIQTLDTFRFISITLVIFFHYLSRWTIPLNNVNYYPYGERFSQWPVIKDGAVGVMFFFMISGFVIFFTLERTRCLKDFLLNRLIRLWPTMFLCSILIFLTFRIFDPLHIFKPFEVSFRNFLPSLTFTSPMFWNVQFMDSAFWSLEVEVKFYILSALVFFNFRRHFVSIWISYTIVVSIANMYMGESDIFKYLFFPTHLPFFSAGIVFYTLFKKNQSLYGWFALSGLYYLCLLNRPSVLDDCLITIFFLLFFTFIYKNEWISWANQRWVLLIGVSSYPLYLLHQHVGVLIINKLAQIASLFGNWQIIYPILVYIIMFIISYIIYKYYETPLKIKMKLLLISPKNRHWE